MRVRLGISLRCVFTGRIMFQFASLLAYLFLTYAKCVVLDIACFNGCCTDEIVGGQSSRRITYVYVLAYAKCVVLDAKLLVEFGRARDAEHTRDVQIEIGACPNLRTLHADIYAERE